MKQVLDTGKQTPYETLRYSYIGLVKKFWYFITCREVGSTKYYYTYLTQYRCWMNGKKIMAVKERWNTQTHLKLVDNYKA